MTPTDQGVIEFSRGCIFKCKFCNFPVLGVKGDYTRSQDSVYEQLMFNYDNYGMQDYGISDETFNDRTEKITKFADVVEKLPWKPYFNAFVRPDLLVSRPKDREEMLRLGVHAHLYGVESFNAKSAKYVGKGMDPERLQAGLLDVKQYFKKHIGHRYRAQISLITGLPHETADTLEQTRQWINKHWLDQNVSSHPLLIHKLGEPRPSDIDESYESLGYSVIPNEERANLTNNDSDHLDAGQLELYEQGIVWKNEHMNFYDAVTFASKINNVYTKYGVDLRRLQPLYLPLVYSDSEGNILNTDSKLKLIGRKITEAEVHSKIYIQKYIDKKLSI
jgi:radical SAM superfamily enzyme YgiQ (UPF0313 family)